MVGVIKLDDIININFINLLLCKKDFIILLISFIFIFVFIEYLLIIIYFFDVFVR